jgi:hypothetical protein
MEGLRAGEGSISVEGKDFGFSDVFHDPQFFERPATVGQKEMQKILRAVILLAKRLLTDSWRATCLESQSSVQCLQQSLRTLPSR